MRYFGHLAGGRGSLGVGLDILWQSLLPVSSLVPEPLRCGQVASWFYCHSHELLPIMSSLPWIMSRINHFSFKPFLATRKVTTKLVSYIMYPTT